MLNREEWKQYRDWSYEVSNHGAIVRVNNKGKKLHKDIIGKCGYSRTTIWKDGKAYTVLVHCVVAEVFLGDRPKGYQVNHIDGNKQNNCVNNLEYITAKENRIHAVKNGLAALGERHGKTYLSKETVREIRRTYKNNKMTWPELAAMFNIPRTTARNIATGITWQHLPEENENESE